MEKCKKKLRNIISFEYLKQTNKQKKNRQANTSRGQQQTNTQTDKQKQQQKNRIIKQPLFLSLKNFWTCFFSLSHTELSVYL